jgi:hypothetical protein
LEKRNLEKKIDILRIVGLEFMSSQGVFAIYNRICEYLEGAIVTQVEFSPSITAFIFESTKIEEPRYDLYKNSWSHTYFAQGLNSGTGWNSKKCSGDLSIVEPQDWLTKLLVGSFKPSNLFLFFIDDKEHEHDEIMIHSLRKYAINLDHRLADFAKRISWDSLLLQQHIFFVTIKKTAPPLCSLTWTCTRRLQSGKEVKNFDFEYTTDLK